MITTVVVIACVSAALGAAAWQSWRRLIRPRVVLWYVRRRYGALAARAVRATGLHRRR